MNAEFQKWNIQDDDLDYSILFNINNLLKKVNKQSVFEWPLRKGFTVTVKPVLNGHSKMDKTKVLKTNGSLMKIESIAECSEL